MNSSLLIYIWLCLPGEILIVLIAESIYCLHFELVDIKSLLLLYTLVESRKRWLQEAWPSLSVDWIRSVPCPA